MVICYSSHGKLIYFPCGTQSHMMDPVHPGTQSPFLNFLFCLCPAPTPWVSLPGIEPVPPAVAARSLNHWSARAVLQSPSFYDSTRHQALGVCCIQPVGGETTKDGSGRFFSTRVVSGKHNFYSHSIVFTHAKMSYWLKFSFILYDHFYQSGTLLYVNIHSCPCSRSC